MKNKFCREILSLSFLALLFLQLPAQQKALKIGDVIPEEMWTTPLAIVNSPNKTTTLAKDRDKLILLDFWATWCGSCLKNFPKMEALEKQFEGKVKVIPVTKEDHATLAKFFATKNGQRYKELVSVAGDQLLSNSFPHIAIPFIIWIKEGKVINTTDADQVTATRIQEILKDMPSQLQTVIQIDRARPLMLAEQFDLEKGTSLLNYALFSKGRIRAVAPGNGFHRTNGVITGRQFTNVSLLRIYGATASELFKAQGQHYSRKRLVKRVKDPALLDFTPADDNETLDAKSYSMEFLVPSEKAALLYPEMFKALNAYSGYTGTLQMQRRKCLVLKKPHNAVSADYTASPKNLSSLGQPLESLLADLNELPLTAYPIIDESGYQGSVRITAEKITDLPSLNKILKSAGFELEETERDLLMLVLEDQVANL